MLLSATQIATGATAAAPLGNLDSIGSEQFQNGFGGEKSGKTGSGKPGKGGNGGLGKGGAAASDKRVPPGVHEL